MTAALSLRFAGSTSWLSSSSSFDDDGGRRNRFYFVTNETRHRLLGRQYAPSVKRILISSCVRVSLYLTRHFLRLLFVKNGGRLGFFYFLAHLDFCPSFFVRRRKICFSCASWLTCDILASSSRMTSVSMSSCGTIGIQAVRVAHLLSASINFVGPYFRSLLHLFSARFFFFPTSFLLADAQLFLLAKKL